MKECDIFRGGGQNILWPPTLTHSNSLSANSPACPQTSLSELLSTRPRIDLSANRLSRELAIWQWHVRENSSPVKLLIQAGSQIEAGSPIQAGGFRSLVSIEAGSLIQAGSPIGLQYKPGDAILMTLSRREQRSVCWSWWWQWHWLGLYSLPFVRWTSL